MFLRIVRRRILLRNEKVHTLAILCKKKKKKKNLEIVKFGYEYLEKSKRKKKKRKDVELNIASVSKLKMEEYIDGRPVVIFSIPQPNVSC